jgi:hypothetical protein
LAFRNGGTFFGAGGGFPRSGFPRLPFPRHRPFVSNWGYWPAYYGGYIPFDYDYGLTPGTYTGYDAGTFDSAPYAGYPYPPAYGGNPYGAPYPNPSAYAPPPSPPAQQSVPAAQSSGRAPQPEPVSEPTVLVFRDGHKQEVDNYAIMGSTLFVLSGRRARIPIAELDVPETIRQNQNRGLDFRIPDQAQ